MLSDLGKTQTGLKDWEYELMRARQRKREEDAPKLNYFVGLDLGQVNDFSALVIDEVETSSVDPKVKTHQIRAIERWQDVPYTEIVDRVCNLFETPILQNQTLVIDHTGVGRAVYDMFVRARPKCKVVPVTITAGSNCTPDGAGWHIAKRELVSILQSLLGTRRLTVVKDLPGANVLINEMRTFKVKVNPVTGNETFEAAREKDHDDLVLAACLAENTPIMTREGLKPICEVTIKDQVVTRAGWRKVLWSGMTSSNSEMVTVESADGGFLDCTPGHRIWTQRGWVAAGDLILGDKGYLCQSWKRWSGAVKYGGDTQNQNVPIIETISKGTHAIKTPRYFCTERFGSQFMGIFQRGFKSITRMATRSTIESTISNALRSRIIEADILKNTEIEVEAQNSWNILHESGNQVYAVCVNGSSRRLANSVNGKTPKQCWPIVHGESLHAYAAARRVNHRCLKRSFVQIYAAKEFGRARQDIQVCADGAVSTLWPNAHHECFAPIGVRLLAGKRRKGPVYDLTVDGCHEFVAGGLLVHNSVAAWVAEKGTKTPWIW